MEIIERTHEEDKFFCGRIAEFEKEITFNALVEKLENILEEPVQSWKFKDGRIKKYSNVLS